MHFNIILRKYMYLKRNVDLYNCHKNYNVITVLGLFSHCIEIFSHNFNSVLTI